MRWNWLLAALLTLTRPAPTQQPALHSYQGTVQAVRRQAHELDLLTQVGEVLRVVRVRWVAATEVTSGGSTVAIAQILRGDLIRTECHETDQGLVADRIEKLGRFEPSGQPDPRRP